MFNDFENSLKYEGKSVNTISSYINDLTLFFNEFSELTRDNIRKFIKIHKEYSATTINRKLSSIKKYNEYLIEIEEMTELLIHRKDYIQIQNKGISPNKIPPDKMRDFFHIIKQTESIQTYTIIALMLNTGLRISETINIKLPDINLEDHEITVRGKGNKQRTVLLNNFIIDLLQSYILNLPKNKHEYIFTNATGGKLHRTQINNIISKYSDIITPHQLRHSYASKAVKNMSLPEVAAQLGHNSITTTQKYTHPTKEEMMDKINKISFT
jgi:site-specific recombinase XerD